MSMVGGRRGGGVGGEGRVVEGGGVEGEGRVLEGGVCYDE